MSDPPLFGIVLICVSLAPIVGGLFLVSLGRKLKQRSAAIEETAPTPASDLRPGKTELRGTARPTESGPRLRAHISQVPAIASTVRVEEYRSQGGESGGGWKRLHSETRTVPFVLADDTGQVAVDPPESAEVLVDLDRTRVNGGEEPPAPIREFVERERTLDEASGRKLGPVSIGDKRRYSEGYIQPDESVYVLGRTSERTGWDGPDYVVDSPTAEGRFIISNKSAEQLITESSQGGLALTAIGGFVAALGVLFLIAALGWIFVL